MQLRRDDGASDVERIRSAEVKVAELQTAFDGLQSVLQTAERVAVAAEVAKAKADQLMKVTVGLVGVSIVLIGLSSRRPR